MSNWKRFSVLVIVVLFGSCLVTACYRTADDDDGTNPPGDDDLGDDDQNTNDDDNVVAPKIPHGEQGNCLGCRQTIV